MQSCVLVFNPRSGIGDQTVTGVIDRNGNPFVGKLFLFQLGGSAVNTLRSSPTAFANAFAINQGLDTGSAGGGSGSADIPQFGVKIASGGASTGYSILNVGANAFFGGDIYRVANITAVRSGEFDIHYDKNDITGDSILCTVLGGSDLTFDLVQSITNTTVTTGTETVAVLHQYLTSGVGSSKSASNGAGGTSGISYGWDTKDGSPGAALTIAPSQNINCRYQRTDSISLLVDTNTFTAVGGNPTVSAWLSNGYTISGASGGHPAIAIAFSGIKANSGFITKPLTTGHQSFNVGIKPVWLMMMSIGAPSSASVRTDRAELSTGWANGLFQGCYWAGETASNQPLTGAGYLSNTDLVRLATANGPSTSFTSIASLVSMTSDGEITINWSAVDGNADEILWLVLGEDAVPVTIGTPLSGIYKMTPGRTKDTLYASFDPEVRLDKKIPDPLAISYLFGDEP